MRNRKICFWAVLTSFIVVFAVSVHAQEQDTAYIPFLVNVDATVKAVQGTAVFEMNVEANKADTLKVIAEAGSLTSVFQHTQTRQNAPTLISGSHGKIFLNLPLHSYKKADISLHSLSGKRILRSKVSASEAVKNISRTNLVAGVYLLSVKGANGQSFSNRFTHRGGNLNINVAFGSERNLTASSMTTADTPSNNWTITISAAGHADFSYTLNLNKGVNALQAKTLNPKGSNPLVGEWREVGSTDIRGVSVFFTDTTFNVIAYLYDPSTLPGDGAAYRECINDDHNRCGAWWDNARYLLLSNDTLEILDRNVTGAQQSYPYKTSIVFHSNDTLEIKTFVPSGDQVLFPHNFYPITLYRRLNYEN